MTEEEKPIKKYSQVLKLPPDLLRAVLSKETPVKISEICVRSKVRDEKKLEEIGYQTGRVLLGKLPPERFQKILEVKLGLNPEIAEKINRETNQTIFDPLKESLDRVYKKEAAPPKPEVKPPPPPEEKPVPRKADVYREPVE